jgi:hypothetical protein
MNIRRAELILYVVAFIVAALLMIPLNYFMFIFGTFALGFFVLLGIGVVAVIGPVIVLIQTIVLRWLPGPLQSIRATLHLWLCALIVHCGASFGFSRLGDVASSMGAKNSTYTEAFIFPVAFVGGLLKEALIGKPSSDVSGWRRIDDYLANPHPDRVRVAAE